MSTQPAPQASPDQPDVARTDGTDAVPGGPGEGAQAPTPAVPAAPAGPTATPSAEPDEAAPAAPGAAPTEPEPASEASTPVTPAPAPSPVEPEPAPEASTPVTPSPAPAPAAPASAPAVPGGPTATPAAPTPAPAAPAAPEDAPAEPGAAPDPAAVGVPTTGAPVTTDFGRIDEEGNVFVVDGGTERLIGGYPAGVPENPFALYTRRFQDLEATVRLFEDRLPQLSPKDIDQTLRTLRQAVVEPAAIGDLPALRARVEELGQRAEERKQQAHAERQAAKEAALAERTALVERAEALVAQDPDRIHWKQSGQQLRDLLEEWKGLQRRGPRLDKTTEDELWKRFSGARTVFDRRRRQFFSALDQKQAEAKSVKESLIAEAEALQNSTDWGATSAAYRGLMDRWKAAPRASRKEDDALWARFRAAQQVFFDARRAKDEAADSEYQENIVAKEALLAEAEALLPVTDADTVKPLLRGIQDRWDEIGRVPGSEVSRIEGRMRAVEDAVRQAEEREWKRSNPETRARAEGMLGQLEQQVADLEADLAAARAAGDERRVTELQDTLTTKKAWLDQIQGSIG